MRNSTLKAGVLAVLVLILSSTSASGAGIGAVTNGSFQDGVNGRALGFQAYGGKFYAGGTNGIGADMLAGPNASYGAQIIAQGANSYGAVIVSDNYRALYARGDMGDFDARFDGDTGISVAGNCIGCALATVVKNVGEETLEKGDVVALTGVVKSFDSAANKPIMSVAKLDEFNQNAVFGVVSGQYVPQFTNRTNRDIEFREETGHVVENSVVSGNYVVVVYHGMAQIKVDASSARIAVGDSLTGISNYAVSAIAGDLDPAKSVKFQALENMDSGKGLIWSMLR